MARSPGAAEERYADRHGDHYAAGITYFSVLALVPLVMVAFAVSALVLLANPDLLARLKDSIGAALPAGLDQTLNPCRSHSSRLWVTELYAPL